MKKEGRDSVRTFILVQKKWESSDEINLRLKLIARSFVFGHVFQRYPRNNLKN